MFTDLTAALTGRDTKSFLDMPPVTAGLLLSSSDFLDAHFPTCDVPLKHPYLSV